MNKKQLKTIFITIGILSVMLLFPPWQYRLEHPKLKNKTAIGPYQLILIGPPEVPITSKTKNGSPGSYFNNFPCILWNAEIDWGRLILPSVIVVLIASGLVLYYKENKVINTTSTDHKTI